MQKNKGKIITVTSTKGGVGKTILALNLAGVYSLLGKSVIIVDLDLYSGNIATFVNSKNDRTIFNLVEDYSNNRYEAIEDYIYKYNDLISVIAAPKDPRLANKIDNKYISLILNSIVYKYDIVIIDTAHTLTSTNIVTLDISDSILYVFSNDTFDLKNTRSFMSIIKDVGFDNVYTLLNCSILNKSYFSMYDIRNIINYNVDFTLSDKFYIKNIDKYIMDGMIPILNPALGITNKSDYKKFVSFAKEMIADKEVKK